MAQGSPAAKRGNSGAALTSTNEVIDALGGTRLAAQLMGYVQTAASNWRHRDHFPPNTYLAMTQALAAQGLNAPAWLWDQAPRPPANSAEVNVGGHDDLWSPGGAP
jgi:hypothetical protein